MIVKNDLRKYTSAEYLECLIKGFGQVDRKDQSVAIVGAGMAGLVAAWLPKDAGFTVTVYEASLRVGGRVKTLRDGFTSGLYAEAGAMRIPNTHTLTYMNGGRSFTDLPIRWVHYPAPNQCVKTSGRGVLLASYTWGEDSLRWGSLKPDDRIRFALRYVASLHRIEEGILLDLLVGGMSHSWAEDEYTFGAFALFDPHQETDMFNYLAAARANPFCRRACIDEARMD